MPAIYVSDKSLLPKRKAFDLYATEPGIINVAMKELLHTFFKGGTVIDAGAGDGRWGDIVKRNYPHTKIIGVDIREVQPASTAFSEWYDNTDYLTFEPSEKVDLVIGNPPFKYAEEFVRHSWDLIRPWGVILFLLPIEFQCSVGRYNNLWTTHAPVHVTLLARRPSFYDGKTGGSEYGLYIWEKTSTGLNMNMAGCHWTTSIAVHERGDYNANSG